MARTHGRSRMVILRLALMILSAVILTACDQEGSNGPAAGTSIDPERSQVREPAAAELSALMTAAGQGDLETLRELLEAGIDPNATDEGGFAPLHSAARFGHLEPAILLIEHGADLNHQSENGNAPLHWAARAGQYELARFLLEAGAEPNLRNAVGGTPLRFALNNNYRQVVELLIEHGGEE